MASRDLKGGESPEDPREKIEAGMQLIGIVAMSAPLKVSGRHPFREDNRRSV